MIYAIAILIVVCIWQQYRISKLEKVVYQIQSHLVESIPLTQKVYTGISEFMRQQLDINEQVITTFEKIVKG